MIQSVNQHPIHDIFDSDAKYYYFVPKYQREYIWSYSQWENLYDDLRDNGEGYFIGSIICINIVHNSFFCPILEVIDGQQRLTTLSIFMSAIYNTLTAFKTELEDRDEIDLLSTLRKSLRRESSPNGLVVVPQVQGHNADDYKYLMYDNGILNPQKITKPICHPYFPSRKMARCYNYFLGRIKNDLETAENPLQMLIDLNNKVKQAVLVKIEVANHNDAYMLFESLNDRGTPLSAIDLMKNSILAHADQHKLKVDDCYEQWKRLIDVLTDDYRTQERFFRHYYNSFKRRHNAPFIADDVRSKEPLGIIATKSNLLSIYEKLINHDLVGFLEDITYCGEIYARFINPEIEDDKLIRSALSDLMHIQGAPSYELLLYLFYNREQLKLSNKTLSDTINLLACFFVRRNITDTPNTMYLDRIFLNIIAKLEDCTWNGYEVYDYIHKVLKEVSASDELFQEKLSGDIYEDNVGVARYVLCKLCENAMTTETWTNLWVQNVSNNSSKKTYVWTIEHIFPEGENIPSSWVNMIADGDKDLAKQYKEEYVHKIGNLTVSGFNSALSNKSFQEKRDRQKEGKYIGYKNGLEINAELANRDNWTIDAIKERTTRLVEQLVKMFAL